MAKKKTKKSKRDKDLFSQLREKGVGKSAADQISKAAAAADSGKDKAGDALAKAAEDLRALAADLEKRIPGHAKASSARASTKATASRAKRTTKATARSARSGAKATASTAKRSAKSTASTAKRTSKTRTAADRSAAAKKAAATRKRNAAKRS